MPALTKPHISDGIFQTTWGEEESNAVSKLAQVDCKNHNSKINLLKDHVAMIIIQSHKLHTHLNLMLSANFVLNHRTWFSGGTHGLGLHIRSYWILSSR